MIRHLLFVILLASVICGSSCKKTYPVPSNKDINAIVQIITQDTSLINQYSLSKDLRKLKVVDVDTADGKIHMPFPPGSNKIYFLSFIISKYWFEKDKEYLFFQNDILKKYTIAQNDIGRLHLTSFEEQKTNGNKRNYNWYCDLTIPIFSLDQKHAYVEITYHNPGGGGASVIFLKKENGNWKILNKYMLWIA